MRRIYPLLAAAALAGLLAAQVKPPAERAREVVDLLLDRKYDALYETFDDNVKKALPVETLKSKVGQSLDPLGKVKSYGVPRLQKVGTNDVVVLPLDFEAVNIDAQVVIDAQGRIAGLLFRPRQQEVPWTAPPYAKPDSFTEREATVGTDDWRLPGTLTVPNGKGPFPAVVLVHGSGPNDRDESVGGFKVFKDLAQGLASSGVAVLRYEKRTRVHGARLGVVKDFSVNQETIDDAVLAAALLRSTDGIDPKRVFVLGHSLGGYLLPRIAARDPKLAGAIALAGSTRPLEDLMVEQIRYLTSLAPESEASKQQVERMEKMAAQIKDAAAGKSTESGMAGAPVSYWVDLKDYDPAAMAARLTLPLLILQGERDYQVTMKDFARWQAALGGRKNATLKSYPKLNHLFAAGEGRSTPAEYSQPGHVDAELVTDLVKWIVAH
jgi:uncharacterized protein